MPAVANLEVEAGTGNPQVARRGRVKGQSKYQTVVEQSRVLTRGHWLRVKASNCKGGKFASLVRQVLKKNLENFDRFQVVTLEDGNVGVIRQR